jgi:hypothetical protein
VYAARQEGRKEVRGGGWIEAAGERKPGPSPSRMHRGITRAEAKYSILIYGDVLSLCY